MIEAAVENAQLSNATVQEISPGLVIALDDLYLSLCADHPDLPRALVTFEEPHPAVLYRVACWRAGRIVTAAGVFEGRIAFGYPSEHRSTPRLFRYPPERFLEIIAHEAAHALATVRGIKDTSRRGTYHNDRFRDLAVELGLDVSKDDRYGWCRTESSAAMLARYGSQLAAFADALPRVGRN